MSAAQDSSAVTKVPASGAIRAGLLVTTTLIVVFGLMMALGSIAPVTFLVAGQQGPSVAVITEDFGAPTNPRPGYDGQQVYAIARAFPHLSDATDDLDNPSYRDARILQPMLASPAPDGSWLVFALFCFGAIGIGLAVGAMTDLAARHGRNPLIGMLAIPALLLPLAITTTEALAYGLAFVSVAFLDRRRIWPAVAVGILAVLARETAIVVLGIAVLGALPTQKLRALPVAVIPAVVLLGWMALVASLVPGRSSEHLRPLALFDLTAGGLAFVVGVMAIGLLGAWTWRDVPVLWPVSLVFALAPLLLRVEVLDPLALPRVIAPALLLGLTGAAGWVAARSRSHTPLPAPA